jgi:signal peptidase II
MTKMVSTKSKLIVSTLIIFVSITVDQITKWLAWENLRGRPGYSYFGGIFRLEYAENTGAFLSLGADMSDGARTAFFVFGVLGILIFCAYWLFKSAHNWLAIISLAAVISGGIGNLIDRVSRGAVIDFLFMGIGPVRTGVFNVADIAITGGLMAMLLEQYLAGKNENAERKS